MNNNIKGFIYCLIGFLFGAINNVLYKFLHRLPAAEIVTFRYFFATLIIIPLFLKNKILFHTNNIKLHMLRGTIVLGTIFSYVIGFKTTYLSTGTLITTIIPFWAMIFSNLLLKEKIKLHRIIILSLIFIIVVFVIDISKVEVNTGSIVLFLGTICSGLYDTLNKKSTNVDNSITSLFYLNLFAFIISAVISINFIIIPTAQEIFFTMMLGIGSNILTICLLKALEKTDASFISPLRYLEFVYSVILGKIIFNENPPSKIYISSFIIVILQIILTLMEENKKNDKPKPEI